MTEAEYRAFFETYHLARERAISVGQYVSDVRKEGFRTNDDYAHIDFDMGDVIRLEWWDNGTNTVDFPVEYMWYSVDQLAAAEAERLRKSKEAQDALEAERVAVAKEKRRKEYETLKKEFE